MNKIREKIIVSKSNRGIFAQLILTSGETKLGQKFEFKKPKPPVEQALVAGENFGEKVIKLGIKSIVFDRSRNIYHGQVKAFADGLRKAGLQF